MTEVFVSGGKKAMALVEQVKDVPAYIRKMYGYNSFMNTFGVHIDEITCGGAVVSIDIDPQKHFNHRGICHGGVFTALADSVLGVTGASVGAAVATLNFSMNFIKNVHSISCLAVTLASFARFVVANIPDSLTSYYRTVTKFTLTTVCCEREPSFTVTAKNVS